MVSGGLGRPSRKGSHAPPDRANRAALPGPLVRAQPISSPGARRGGSVDPQSRAFPQRNPSAHPSSAMAHSGSLARWRRWRPAGWTKREREARRLARPSLGRRQAGKKGQTPEPAPGRQRQARTDGGAAPVRLWSGSQSVAGRPQLPFVIPLVCLPALPACLPACPALFLSSID